MSILRRAIAQSLKQQGITQKEASGLIEVSPQHLSNYLNGRGEDAKGMSAGRIDRLIEIAGVVVAIAPNP